MSEACLPHALNGISYLPNHVPLLSKNSRECVAYTYFNYLHLAINLCSSLLLYTCIANLEISYIPAYIYAVEKEGISGKPTERNTTKGKPESVPACTERGEQLKIHNSKQ